MVNAVFTATGLGFLTATTSALPTRHNGLFHYEGGVTWGDGSSSLTASSGIPVDSHSYYFEQRVDHFDRENMETFQQRLYFCTD